MLFESHSAQLDLDLRQSTQVAPTLFLLHFFAPGSFLSSQSNLFLLLHFTPASFHSISYFHNPASQSLDFSQSKQILQSLFYETANPHRVITKVSTWLTKAMYWSSHLKSCPVKAPDGSPKTSCSIGLFSKLSRGKASWQVRGSGCPGSDQTSWPSGQYCSPGWGRVVKYMRFFRVAPFPISKWRLEQRLPRPWLQC